MNQWILLYLLYIIVKLFRWIRNNIIVPDGRIGWYPNAVSKGDDIIKQNNNMIIDATYNAN